MQLCRVTRTHGATKETQILLGFLPSNLSGNLVRPDRCTHALLSSPPSSISRTFACKQSKFLGLRSQGPPKLIGGRRSAPKMVATVCPTFLLIVNCSLMVSHILHTSFQTQSPNHARLSVNAIDHSFQFFVTPFVNPQTQPRESFPSGTLSAGLLSSLIYSDSLPGRLHPMADDDVYHSQAKCPTSSYPKRPRLRLPDRISWELKIVGERVSMAFVEKLIYSPILLTHPHLCHPGNE